MKHSSFCGGVMWPQRCDVASIASSHLCCSTLAQITKWPATQWQHSKLGALFAISSKAQIHIFRSKARSKPLCHCSFYHCVHCRNHADSVRIVPLTWSFYCHRGQKLIGIQCLSSNTEKGHFDYGHWGNFYLLSHRAPKTMQSRQDEFYSHSWKGYSAIGLTKA